MDAILNATDVRKHWGQFNDDVVREGPQFVKRNRDKWAALSIEHLQVAFQHFTFNAEFFTEEDGTITGSLQNFDITENAISKNEVIEQIAEELIEYANEYQENFNQYFHSPNRKEHFPYILNVLSQEDIEGVKSLIHA